MKFAINTNCMRKVLSVAEIVQLAEVAGVDAIEWGLPPLGEASNAAQEMSRRSRDAGLEILSFVNAGSIADYDEIRFWSEIAAANGATRLRVAHPWYAWDYGESTHQVQSFPALLEATSRHLQMLEESAREFQLQYLLETHSGSTFASPLAVLSVMKKLDANFFGVIYDPANTCLEGFLRPRAAIELLGDYLAYVHVKNLTIQWQNGSVSYQKSSLAEGAVNYEEVAFALKLAGREPFFSFEELYSAPENFQSELQTGIAHLKKCMESAPDQLQQPYLKL